ncbi:hypothetical protein [Rhizobium sp. L51/94]|uniref:hypothetical protein n=1 Tax=Rhizobium sp. L51/94 TaxID=2819999 RepID=UPI001C5BE7D4|nr:hypothetical protein [Rhizobium sp. L51/94]QXZ79683.1 hypothetical protein J5274_06790 [Rhizobium sp. L51/94]
MTGIATRIPNVRGLDRTIDKVVDKRPNRPQGGGSVAFQNRHLVGVRVNSQAELTQFGTWLGRTPDMIHMFCENTNGQTTWAQNLAIVQAFPAAFSWYTGRYDWAFPLATGTAASPTATCADTAAGTYDAIITQMLQVIVGMDASDVIILRIGWEGNLKSAYPWSYNNASGPSDFIAAFRHVVALARAVSSRFRFSWVITPNTLHYSGTGVYDALTSYPGDDVVDMGGADPYYNSQDDGDSPAKAFYSKRIGIAGLDAHYAFLAAKGKPYAIHEFGVNSNSGDYLDSIGEWCRGKNITNIGYWNQGTTTGGSFADKLSGDQYPLASAAYKRQFGPLQIVTPSAFNAPSGSVLTLILEANRKSIWSIVGGANASSFTILAGILVSNSALAAGGYSVTVRATDEAGLTIDRTLTITASVGALQPETQFAVARMTVAPSASMQAADDAFIATLKSIGCWKYLDYLFLMGKTAEQSDYINLASATSRFDLIKSGAPVFTSKGGLSGDGVGGVYSTMFTPNVFGYKAQPDSFYRGHHSLTALLNAGAQSTDIGCDVSLLVNRTTTPAITGRDGNAATKTFAPSAAAYPGWLGMYRVGTTSKEASRGIETASNTSTPDFQMNYPVQIGGSSKPGVYGVNRIAVEMMGGPELYAFDAQIKSAVDAWLTAVAAAA